MKLYRAATAAFAFAFVGIGIALLVLTAIHEGGASGYLIGALFAALGAGRRE